LRWLARAAVRRARIAAADAAAGGRFVVLLSPAERGVQVRATGTRRTAARTQLTAAHERAPGGRA
jgi:hypothetical protein